MAKFADVRNACPRPDLGCGIPCEDILAGVAGVLEHFVIAAADSGPLKATPFDAHGYESIRSFLYGVARAGLCSKECFILALVYGERVLQKHPDYVISGQNVHRLMLVSVMLASKVLDDFYCRNIFYAKTGGFPIELLNELELTLVFMLDFDLQVKPEEFALYRDSLRRETITREVAMTPQSLPHLLSPVGVVPLKATVVPFPSACRWPGEALSRGTSWSQQDMVTGRPLLRERERGHDNAGARDDVQRIPSRVALPQPVMPITIVPVPQYSMALIGFPRQTPSLPVFPKQTPNLPVYNGLSYLVGCRTHAIAPFGPLNPIRYGWPC